MLPLDSLPNRSSTSQPGDVTALKTERSVRVDLLRHGPNPVVRKQYLNSGLRLLQTMGRRSRAAREFANLEAATSAGLPCTKPVGWAEDRRLGLVHSSTVVTQFVSDSRPLKAVLRELPADAYRARRSITCEIGRLLARLHTNGILWCTAMPRNFLLQGLPDTGRLVLCDLPSAVLFSGRVPPKATLVDLFDAIASPSRRRDFSKTDRLRCLRAYTDDNRAATRKLWRLLNRITVRGHRSRNGFLRTIRAYMFPYRAVASQKAAPNS